MQNGVQDGADSPDLGIEHGYGEQGYVGRGCVELGSRTGKIRKLVLPPPPRHRLPSSSCCSSRVDIGIRSREIEAVSASITCYCVFGAILFSRKVLW